MISFFCRALQWGLVLAIFAKAGSISMPMLAAMLVTAWLAKRVADSRANLAHRPRQYARLYPGGRAGQSVPADAAHADQVMTKDQPPRRSGSIRPDRIDPDESIYVSLPTCRNITDEPPVKPTLAARIRSFLGRSFPAIGRSTKEKPK